MVFSQNQNIFTYDYLKMKNNEISEKLMSVMFHPKI